MSVLKGLFAALGAYWLVVFWRRWSIHARTQQFVLEQRRKAGIPDSDLSLIHISEPTRRS